MQVATSRRCRGCRAPLGPLEVDRCQKPRCRAQALDAARARVVTLADEDRFRLARDALIAKARRATKDPVAFFELVLRDEAPPNRHITVPPHQKTLLSFIQHPKHDKAVIVLPVGTGKTISCGGLGLFLLAQNPSLRGAFISATQEQAKKPLKIVRQTIESSPELRLVAPNLIPSRRHDEPWSDTKITVDRPFGIKDPSFAALGIDSKEIQGWRLDMAIVDDLLSSENTATPEQRQSTYDKFFGQVANRMEPKLASRLCVVNTTWHNEDYVNRLARYWPTLRMSVFGDIYVSNADPDWSPDTLYVVGHRMIQNVEAEHCRLAEHAPDPARRVPLWAARYDAAEIERQRLKYVHAPGLFKKFFESDAHDDSSALCKAEFVERCMAKARAEEIYGLVPTYDGQDPTFTGVDLAVTPDKKGGETSFFTFRVSGSRAAGTDFVCMKCATVVAVPPGNPRPLACRKCAEAAERLGRTDAGELVETSDESYVILDIESGHWDALTIVAKLFAKMAQFRSFAAVENNATQEFLIQVARSMGKDLAIRSHNTTEQGKAHPWQGVIGIFFEMATGRWRIPNDTKGQCPEPVRHFVEKCTSYSAERHTADVLMASFVARSLAMQLGYMASEAKGLTMGISDEARVMRR